MIQYPCPDCNGLMYLDTVHEGHQVPCPHCDRSFVVPVGAVSGSGRSAGGAVDAEWRPAEPEVPPGLQVDDPSSRRGTGGPRVVRGEPMHPARRPADHRTDSRPSGDARPKARRRRQRTPTPRSRGGVGPPPEHNGTAILVLGILTWTICGLCGPIAWIMGQQERSRALRGGYAMSSLAKVGWLLGMVYCLFVIALILLAVLLAVAA